MYIFLNIFYTTLHLSVIAFNLFAWIFPQTRKAHLALVLLTLFSWFVLGFFYGFGYCFLTDWHYDVLYKLGHTNLPSSYITYIFWQHLDWQVADDLVIQTTAWVYFVIVVLSFYLNYRDYRKT